ncbi:hypothetical protein CPC735_030550 [Coccidioides posadasii C735 delta SOWgp]|uniref:Spindle pole body associated protein SnaD n=1 Tax=Coccidioides posadasii (strain C735) TaxID=222929 RepID=C5P4S9_COCP7|nr:hypothetical protein CPC735_030550 [Coccidioides posadasii C735 delta SOWgp]EER27719.1 hypothetical protein CPC735_030550 [Coccidioides posadasii C735 delta SOWgp]|eukprot:XP_003069864.1 hypothetical protein CPC735_030550 [Coccidioides posadasii C735 delta SOWgp]
MAKRESSPFPTSHDTLGISSVMDTPRFIPSSPPRIMSPYRRSGIRHERLSPNTSGINNTIRAQKAGQRRGSTSNGSSDGEDSETHLSDYTFDLNKLPNAVSTLEAQEDNTTKSKQSPRDNDNISEPPGPDDFTENMVELLNGADAQVEQNNQGDNFKDFVHTDRLPGRPAHDEISEIEPPLEMSTPAHVLSGKNGFNNPETLSDKNNSTNEVERLLKELRKKDEIIRANRRRVFDAASIMQQVRHLQLALEQEKQQRQAESASKDQQIRELQSQVCAKDEQLQSSRAQLQELQSLMQSVNQSRHEPKEDGLNDKHKDEELFALQKQFEAKDKSFQQLKARLDETISSHQVEISKKNAENDQLRFEYDENLRELDKLDSDIESLTRERDVLEKRTQDLDKIVQHLESQISELKHNLAMERKEAISSVDALKRAADGVSVDMEGKSFGKIPDSLACAHQKQRDPAYSESHAVGSVGQMEEAERDLTGVRNQLQESKSLNEILSLQLESTREGLSESQSALLAAKDKNSQLLSQLESANSEKSQLSQKLERITQERDEAMRTATDLRNQAVDRQPLSPAPSLPPEVYENQCQHDIDSLQKSHQQEIDRIENSHATELSTFRDTHAKSTRSLHALLRAAQDRESDLQSQLVDLRKSLSSKSKELSALANEQERLGSIIEAKDAAAAALDTKFANVLKRREEVWESRIDKLLRDRERMSKALMWAWGEMEVGHDKPSRDQKATKGEWHTQRYMYRYVERPRSAR